MTQAINAEKLKASAEHLEWVLIQYPNSDDVQKLLSAMSELINAAKTGKINLATERIPCSHLIAEGIYRDFDNPNIESAYYAFAAEMRGGRTQREIDRQARMDAAWQAMKGGGGNE